MCFFAVAKDKSPQLFVLDTSFKIENSTLRTVFEKSKGWVAAMPPNMMMVSPNSSLTGIVIPFVLANVDCGRRFGIGLLNF